MTRTIIPRPLVRAGTALAVPLLLALGLAGCAGGATADGPATSTPTSRSQGAQQAAVTACLRERGYDVDDPDGGEVQLSLPDGVDEQTNADDLADCARQAGVQPSTAADLPQRTDAELRAFGRCVREHGEPDYPDDPEGQASFEPADPSALQRAVDACGGWVPAGR